MKGKKNYQLTYLWVVAMLFGGVMFSPPAMANAETDGAFYDVTALTVSGNVTDEAGEALIGVTILVKGTNQGTVTDFDGNYSLDVPDGNSVLVFSYTGYLTQEITVGAQTIINLSMATDIQALEEVVVVGYGTQKKANLTGAVTVITSDALDKRPITSAGQGLQGLVPGLNITIRDGDPTTGANFNIRGYESINGGSPLILVDGVPMALERINPNDILSVNVLKDASAAAVYGARAAFGVILVETKKGKTGKVNIDLNTELSAAKPIFHVDPVNDPYQYVLARNTASIRTNGQPSFDDDYIRGTKAYSEGTGPAWGVYDGVLRHYGYNGYQDLVMTDYAPQQRYDLSVSGATDKASYYVSFGHLNKDGYINNKAKNEKFKRYNVLMKADFKINDWLSLDEKVVFNAVNSNEPTFYHWDVNINTFVRQNPIDRIKFPSVDELGDRGYYLNPGDAGDYEQYVGRYFGGTNFLPYLEDGGRNRFSQNDLWLTQGITMTPLRGLKIRGDFSYNSYNYNRQNVESQIEVINEGADLTNLIIENGFSATDFIEEHNNYNQYYVFNAYAEYTLDQFDDHYIKGMVGFNQEWDNNTYRFAKAFTLITPGITDLNATTGAQQVDGSRSHAALRGAFYRFNYIYKDKYLFEANGRYDGTSKFPQDDRFGFFPSFSAGWRITEEPFMAGTRNFLDNLKIRASYGTLGNQNVGSFYPYIPTMGAGSSPYMFSGGARSPYVAPPGLVSPTLTWETVVTRNLGVDITLLNNRLDASFDIYTRDTEDMLMNVEFPSVLGTSAPRQNAADLRTKGWEANVTWRDKIGQDWNYRISFNLADWQSEITRYENPTGALNEYYVGQKIGEVWGYESVGIFQTEEEVAAHADQSRLGANWRPGDIQYADLDGDGELTPGNNTLDNPGDRTIIGNESPRLSFGTNLDVSYKNFTLTTFFQGVGKRDAWPSSGNWTWFFPYNAGHVEWYYINDSWSEDNRDAYFHAPTIGPNDGKNRHTQSRYLQDGSYIRLKNVTLTYNFPVDWVQKVGLSRAQLYVSGMNLWEATNMRKPLDPETVPTNVLGDNYGGAIRYPLQRIYSVGARISF